MNLEEMTSIWKAFDTLSNTQELMDISFPGGQDVEAINDAIYTAKLQLHQVLSSNVNLLIEAMVQSLSQGVK